MQVLPVPADMAEKLAAAEPGLFAKIEERGNGPWPVWWLVANAKAGRVLLWAVIDGSEVVSLLASETINEAGGRRVFHVLVAVGSLEGVLEAEAPMIAWAKGQGCDTVKVTCRPGWQKKLKGYALHHVQLEKSIGGTP